MKHKKCFVFFLAFMVFFVLHESYGEENNAVFVNFEGPSLFPKTGIGYERKVNNYFSYLFTGSFFREAYFVADSPYVDLHLETDFLAYFRYYPLQTSLKRLFLDAGIGYRFLLLESAVNGERRTGNLFLVQARIGWKFAIKRFIIQPYIGYCNSFGEIRYYEDDFFKYGFPIFGASLGLLF